MPFVSNTTDLKRDFCDNAKFNKFVDFNGNDHSFYSSLRYYISSTRITNKDKKNIIFVCNDSLESHILSMYLILSIHEVYLISVENFESIEDIRNTGIKIDNLLVFEKDLQLDIESYKYEIH